MKHLFRPTIWQKKRNFYFSDSREKDFEKMRVNVSSTFKRHFASTLNATFNKSHPRTFFQFKQKSPKDKKRKFEFTKRLANDKRHFRPLLLVRFYFFKFPTQSLVSAPVRDLIKRR